MVWQLVFFLEDAFDFVDVVGCFFLERPLGYCTFPFLGLIGRDSFGVVVRGFKRKLLLWLWVGPVG